MASSSSASPVVSDSDLRELIEALTRTLPPGEELLSAAMRILAQHRAKYHWVGVYLLVGDVLRLGPYVGPHTEHERIPVGRGVCGSAVADDENKVIADVRTLSNYLACHLETRSEIVVLIRDPHSHAILGQIDIDGTEVSGFGHDDERFLESIAELLAPSAALVRARIDP